MPLWGSSARIDLCGWPVYLQTLSDGGQGGQAYKRVVWAPFPLDPQVVDYLWDICSVGVALFDSRRVDDMRLPGNQYFQAHSTPQPFGRVARFNKPCKTKDISHDIPVGLRRYTMCFVP